MLIAERLEELQAFLIELRCALIVLTQLRGVPKMIQRPADKQGSRLHWLPRRAALQQQPWNNDASAGHVQRSSGQNTLRSNREPPDALARGRKDGVGDRRRDRRH